MERDFYEAFCTVGWYNGYEEYIEMLIDYLKKEKDRPPIPDFLRDVECDHITRVLWSILVLMFGDYGTSPRFGWIEEVEEAIEYLQKMSNDFENR